MRAAGVTALLLTVCLAVGLLAGCGGQTPDTDALMSEATLAYQCLAQFSLRTDQTLTGGVEIDGRVLRPVLDERFHTLADLRAYAAAWFSDEIVDSLMAENHYVEWEGRLYSDGFDYAIDPTVVSVRYEETERTEDRVCLRATVTHLRLNAQGEETGRFDKTYDYVYEKTERGWVFTDFPYFWFG